MTWERRCRYDQPADSILHRSGHVNTEGKKGRPKKRRRGRSREYPEALFVILMMVKALSGKSNNGIYKALRSGELVLPPPFEGQKPSRRTIDRRLSGDDKAVESLFKRVMRKLIFHLLSSPKAIIIDSTDLPVDPRKDRGGAWGYNSKGKFYGYKLHLISTENSIPLGFKVTVGSVHDVKMFIPLFRDSLPILRRVKTIEYLIGDAAYDSTEAMEVVIGEGLKPVVKLNRRGRKPKRKRAKMERFLQTDEGRKLFSLRGGIERLNSFLKEGMGIARFPSYVKGLKRVKLFVRERILLTLAVMLANLKSQKPLLSYA